MSKAVASTEDRESRSTLSGEMLKDLYEEVKEVYLADARPWVVGFSGGKDSTATLQVVWHSLGQLPPEQRRKPIYVVSSDTLVETPVIVDYLNTTLDRINRASHEKGLTFEAHKVQPSLDDTFWVNMIGRGYPAPSTTFRWCTDRLKIIPTSRFIEDKVARHGEVVIVLGARKGESASRAQVINRSHKERGVGRLSRHTRQTGAWVYTPIEDWTRRDVWDYLLMCPSPWGNKNQDLVTMYKNADGECPLVVGKDTKPCGSSRFGCWTCTLVEQDKSMEALFDNGQDWVEPLLQLRDWLMQTRLPENKHKYRDHRRRTGAIQFAESDGGRKIIWGPYKMEVREEILRKVLGAQERLRKESPYPKVSLINEEQLHRIRQLWRFEEGHWEDAVPRIHREVTGRDLDWLEEDSSGLGGRDQAILKEVCLLYSIPPQLVTGLLDEERGHHGMSRRAGIYDAILRVLRKDWRTLGEVITQEGVSDPSATGKKEALDVDSACDA